MRSIVAEDVSVGREHDADAPDPEEQPTRATAARPRTAMTAGSLRTGTV